MCLVANEGDDMHTARLTWKKMTLAIGKGLAKSVRNALIGKRLAKSVRNALRRWGS